MEARSAEDKAGERHNPVGKLSVATPLPRLTKQLSSHKIDADPLKALRAGACYGRDASRLFRYRVGAYVR